MKFFLDNDVHAEVGRILRKDGHQCHTAAEAGIADATDDEIAVFADDRSMVLVTQDKEFSQRRRRNVYGKHVYLACEQWDAVEVVKFHLEELVGTLGTRDSIFIKVTKTKVKPYPNSWE